MARISAGSRHLVGKKEGSDAWHSAVLEASSVLKSDLRRSIARGGAESITRAIRANAPSLLAKTVCQWLTYPFRPHAGHIRALPLFQYELNHRLSQIETAMHL